MKILSYNVRRGVRGVEWVASVVRDLAPDVACLNDVGRRQLKAIASISSRRIRAKHVFLRTGAGNAILSAGQAEQVSRVRLSRSPGLPPRGLVSVRSGDVVVATTQLGLVGEERLRHAREILDALPGGPLVLAGSFGEEPDGPAIELLRSRFTDAFATSGEGRGETFPANAPKQRIDYVFVSGVRAIRCEVGDSLASDHRPLVAEID